MELSRAVLLLVSINQQVVNFTLKQEEEEEETPPPKLSLRIMRERGNDALGRLGRLSRSSPGNTIHRRRQMKEKNGRRRITQSVRST